MDVHGRLQEHQCYEQEALGSRGQKGRQPGGLQTRLRCKAALQGGARHCSRLGGGGGGGGGQPAKPWGLRRHGAQQRTASDCQGPPHVEERAGEERWRGAHAVQATGLP